MDAKKVGRGPRLAGALVTLSLAAACANPATGSCKEDADCGTGIACHESSCDSARITSQTYGAITYTLTVSPAQVPAGSKATLTLAAKNSLTGQPTPGLAVTFTAGGAANTFTPASGTGVTDATGAFKASVSSTLAQTESITAVLAGQNTLVSSLVVSPGPPSAARSSLTLSGAPCLANGASSVGLAVVVNDAFGNAIPGHAVNLTVTGSGNALSPPSGVTDAAGSFTSQLTSTRSEAKTVSASVPTVFVLSAAATFVPDRAIVTVTATPPSQTANNLGFVSVLVNLKDANGNPVPGEPVSLSLADPGRGTFSPAAGVTDLNGNLGSIRLTSAVAERKVIVATDTSASGPSAGASGSAAVTFTPYTPVASTSSLSAAPSPVPADGASAARITVVARDAFSNPVPGRTVNFAVTGLSAGTAFAPASAVTDQDGQAISFLTSTASGQKTVQITVVNGYQAATAVTFVAAAPSASLSSLAAAPATVAANGTALGTLTATLRDGQGNLVPGAQVTFAGTGLAVFHPPTATATTNAAGVASVTVSSTTASTQTFSASVPGVTLGQTAAVTFVAAPPAAITSSFSAGPGPTFADGASQVRLSINVQDANHNPVPGRAVTFSSPSADVTFSPPAGFTDDTGTFSAGAAATLPGVKTLRAAVGTAFTLPATTLFVAPPSASRSTLAAQPASAPADGTSSVAIALVLRDTAGAPMPGQPVTLAAARSTDLLAAPSGVTGADGSYATTLTSTAPGTATVTLLSPLAGALSCNTTFTGQTLPGNVLIDTAADGVPGSFEGNTNQLWRGLGQTFTLGSVTTLTALTLYLGTQDGFAPLNLKTYLMAWDAAGQHPTGDVLYASAPLTTPASAPAASSSLLSVTLFPGSYIVFVDGFDFVNGDAPLNSDLAQGPGHPGAALAAFGSIQYGGGNVFYTQDQTLAASTTNAWSNTNTASDTLAFAVRGTTPSSVVGITVGHTSETLTEGQPGTARLVFADQPQLGQSFTIDSDWIPSMGPLGPQLDPAKTVFHFTYTDAPPGLYDGINPMGGPEFGLISLGATLAETLENTAENIFFTTGYGAYFYMSAVSDGASTVTIQTSINPSWQADMNQTRVMLEDAGGAPSGQVGNLTLLDVDDTWHVTNYQPYRPPTTFTLTEGFVTDARITAGTDWQPGATPAEDAGRIAAALQRAFVANRALWAASAQGARVAVIKTGRPATAQAGPVGFVRPPTTPSFVYQAVFFSGPIMQLGAVSVQASPGIRTAQSYPGF